MKAEQYLLAIEIAKTITNKGEQTINNLALSYRAIGLSELALDTFSSIDVRSPEALNTLGVLHMDLFEIQKAEAFIDKALSLKQLPTLIWNKSAFAKNTEQAITILENSSDFKSFMALTHYKAKLGDRGSLNDLQNSKLKDHSWSRTLQILDEQYSNAKLLFNQKQVFDFCLENIDLHSVFLEFGVWTGRSFTYLSKHFDYSYGFDTFTGLPEDWHNTRSGSYSAYGSIPAINKGEFVVGEFKDTIPQFFSNYQHGSLSLINIDADLYTSTRTALDHCLEYISDTTLCVFDELFLNANFEKDEYKALLDFCEENALRHHLLAYSLFTKQAVVKFSRS